MNSQLQVKKEAVWELFTSECTYFLDHLLVLKMVSSDFNSQERLNIIYPAGSTGDMKPSLTSHLLSPGLLLFFPTYLPCFSSFSLVVGFFLIFLMESLSLDIALSVPQIHYDYRFFH